ncbi:MAG: hypothetical protein GX303_07950 [Clostridiales bacterium]|nr:hypothetical protein [Clostridiales bacterium]
MKKQLTFFESVCIVAGNGIGGGVMAIPLLFNRAGLLPAIILLTATYIISVFLHIMVADMLLKTKNGCQILSVFNEFLFIGRLGKILSASFFGLLTLILFANLSAYITGGAEIIVSLLGIPLLISKILYYIFSAGLVFFGLKAVGFGEKITVIGILVVTAGLTLLSFGNIKNSIVIYQSSIPSYLTLYAMAMFSLSALFSVPQVVVGTSENKAKIGPSIACGLFINFIVTILISVSSILSSAEVTEIAIIGWTDSLGLPVKIFASLFILFAMITSYWAISLTLADIVKEQLKLNKNICWLIATLPSFSLTFITGVGFADLVKIAGGAVAVIIALLLLPAYNNSLKDGKPPYILRKLGQNKLLIITVAVFYILMAVGSFI